MQDRFDKTGRIIHIWIYYDGFMNATCIEGRYLTMEMNRHISHVHSEDI